MKIFAVCLCIVLPYLLNAQTEDEAAIRLIMRNQQTAWNAGNIDGFMQGYWINDSLVFIGQSGPSLGWQTARDNYKKHYPDVATMGKLQLDISQMRRLSAEYYFVIGKWSLTRKADNVGGNFTLLFKKTNGLWLIVVDHSD
jgi:ketosteroid isomerase-like protein